MELRHSEGAVAAVIYARLHAQRGVGVVEAHACRRREAVAEVERRLVEERRVDQRRREARAQLHLVGREGQRHGRVLRQDGGKHAVEEGHAVGVERHGAQRAHLLHGGKGTRRPFPLAAGQTLEHQFFAKRVAALALREREDVGVDKVLVDEIAVAQVLPCRNRREDEVGRLPFHAGARRGQFAAVAALAVLCDTSRVGTVGGARRLRQVVRAGLLVAIFVGRRQVSAQTARGSPCQAHLTAGGLAAIGLAAAVGIAAEAVLALVESADAHRHAARGVQVGHGAHGAAAVGHGARQAHVRPRMAEGVCREHAHQAAH